MMKQLRIGTRKSLLALAQTRLAAEKIKAAFPKIEIEIVTMTTKGDERLDRALSSFGGKGVFTKELEEGLYAKTIDIAVHSAKDMPVVLPKGLIVGAVLERGDTRDVVVTMDGTPLKAMKAGTVIGTGSLRRQLQLEALAPGVCIKPIRGNVQTRLNKLADGEYDAVVLAGAGLERLHYKEASDFDYSRFCYEFISEDEILPAAAQGILAIECREDNDEVRAILNAVCDTETLSVFEAERSFLKAIGGSCNAPAAALAKFENGLLTMRAVYTEDGSRKLRKAEKTRPAREAVSLGREVAQQLQKKGFVYLIGAGPGDKELMTIKGLKALKSADTVIYDNLASNALLQEASRSAELIYAGKRAGAHYMKQDEISALIVKKAKEGKCVARLKGGDPFIFGRGGEEALALFKECIDYEVIPGISSSYAVAAYNGIPVTHRGLASSFHVITGHEDAKKEDSVLDYETLAREEGTLVFLMGLKNLPKITEKLIACGKDKNTPAAVMQEGTTARQKIVTGTLENIVQKAEQAKIKTPAITIIGEVVGLREKLSWYGKKPLSGKSVLVTATDSMTKSICEKLRALGAEALDFGLIYTEPIHGAVLEQWLKAGERFTWLVFTSKNGVDIFFEHLKKAKVDIRKLDGVKFAVIGKGTQKALEDRGIFCDCLPTLYSSADLGKALIPMLSKEDRVLLLRAKEASKELPGLLDEAGIAYKSLPIYKTSADERKGDELNRMLEYADYITFCSASAVKAFDKMIKKPAAFKGEIICIGPVTAKAAEDLGYKVCKEAVQYDIDGLVESIVQAARESKSEA